MTASGTAPARPSRRRSSTRSVTLSDVSRVARVSPQTVSRTLRNPQVVSPETLERVRQAISDTGYVPNLAASHLASNRSRTVAAIIPSISASVFADALHGLDEVLTPVGYQLFIGATDYQPEREEELIRTFLGRRPDAFFIVGTNHTPAASKLLRAAGVPVVEAWNWTDDPIDTLVGFSNSAAIRAVVEHVVARGYRHPTFAGSLHAGDSRAVARKASFEDSVRALMPGEPVRTVDSGTREITMDTGRVLMDKALAAHPETDVLLFSSDVFAAGAPLDCLRRGIRVREQLAITGFGDFEVARHLVPSLTTVAVPNREIGTRAGELLLSRMTGDSEDRAEVDLGFSIVARDSA